MRKIPDSVRDHMSNARYYLEAASTFPYPTYIAVRILLILTAWEHIKIAEEELSAWARQTVPSRDLYKSHEYKFRELRRPITRVIQGESGTPAKTIIYSSAADIHKLLSICRYGPRTGSKRLTSIFERGWHTDSFKRSLISKIEWEEMMVNIYENGRNH